MFRRLFTPRWMGALALAILYAFLGYHLGHWQYGRYEFKAERNALLNAHYRAAPVPATDVLSHRPVNRAKDDWTRVTASGTYAGEQLLVRNRPNNSVFGYEVLAPLRLADGTTVVVDRGWVQNSDRGAAVVPDVPPAPQGEVTVVGWVRPLENTDSKKLPSGQVASISLPDVEKAWRTQVLDGYVVLDAEQVADGASPARPAPLADPDRSLGPHQAYAFQWWMSMPVGLFLIWLGLRRELRDEQPERPAKPKKVRIWDEEDY
ncbi:SURF1 family protein [Janibacter sp. HTCC2649]|uniref:SURF1 family cytochrome oxidase biogenesis protein n=1 Tax=Janibacter sp. HTCC2649 TaxID=313589 RepID=UPI0011D1A166|nr:SURF1 family protein [Janibacter sp. HTCC2649]